MMKTSLKKLRALGLNKLEKRERRLQHSLAQLNELAHASQDMLDMRDCYEGLLSAAAATSNCAYEFSESLREMGDCLLEKTALNDDEESGKVLLMLGKVQFEIQKLVDNYRSHIFQTIAIPSESLLNELRIVEEMKRQCDDKRRVYDQMIGRYKEKGRSRSSKGECFSSHQLQTANDEYDQLATLFVFRMKSLKQGQSRSLLTQAARHHAAQLCFFRKALKSLETIEPHVKFVTENQHIDYQFSGLEENVDGGDNSDDDDEQDSEDGSEMFDDGELSFDYGQNNQRQDVSTTRNSMELGNVDLTFPHVARADTAKENVDQKLPKNSFALGRDFRTSSQSAPLFVEKKADLDERFKNVRPISTQKLHTYVLPTPLEIKSPVSSRLDTHAPQIRRTSLTGSTLNFWHSSPLEQGKYEKILNDEKLSGPIIPSSVSVLKESNDNITSGRLPPPLTDGLSSPQLNALAASAPKKIKRQAFSGPLTSKSSSSKPILADSGPIVSTAQPQLYSGSILYTPMPRPASSPKLSSNASPTFTSSSPKISELHELPRPPPHLSSKKSSNVFGHSSPLGFKGEELSADKLVGSNAASTLLAPPQAISRSYSIPSGGQREMALHVPGSLEAPQDIKMVEEIFSPPLTPIPVFNI